MKVVIATPLYPPEIGGPATYAAVLARELPKRGVEVVLVKFSDVRHLPKLFRHVVYYKNLLSVVRTADVVLALDPVSVGLPALWAAKKCKKPFVVKVVGDYAWEQGAQRFGVTDSLDAFIAKKQSSLPVRFLQKIQTRVAVSATRVIVPSEYLKHVVSSWGVATSAISVIHNAVPVEAPGALPASLLGLPRPLIVSVGRLVPWKGFEGLIEAVASMHSGGIRASLAIIGEGPLYESLQHNMKEQLGAGSAHLGALGHPETLAAIQHADVFALNSSYEGLSHTLIEALSLGVPIVATRAGGNSELVTDGENGLLTPVGDTTKLAEALTSLVRDKELGARLREGAKRSAGRFAEEGMVGATTALFNEIAVVESKGSVLMISGDRHVLHPGSEAAKRLELQKATVARLDVFVWPQVHSSRTVTRAARKGCYDVVTTQDPFWRGLLGWFIARRMGAKLNVQVHTDLSAYSGFRRLLSSFVLRHADSVRVVGEQIRAQVLLRAPSARISVLPVYIDVERFQKLEHTPAKGGAKTILWVGRFEREKDPLAALAVLKAVRAAGVDARLIMLGSGSLEAAVREAASSLAPHVELPGWQDPLPYLKKADVVVSTSLHESYGASMIEALAAGVPVVSPDYGIAKEAGATIAPKTQLGSAVAMVLTSGARGELKLPCLSAEAWARAWRETL